MEGSGATQGRSRWDSWLQDAQRLAYDHWHRQPNLRDAYFEGYGREPTDAEGLQLDLICLVNAIATIPWALRHKDEAFAALGREMIQRVRTKLG